jgi:hypothetical protein
LNVSIFEPRKKKLKLETKKFSEKVVDNVRNRFVTLQNAKIEFDRLRIENNGKEPNSEIQSISEQTFRNYVKEEKIFKTSKNVIKNINFKEYLICFLDLFLILSEQIYAKIVRHL